MRFIIPTIALAVSVAALPESAEKMGKLSTSVAFREQGEGSKCDVGSISCCNSAAETKNDGFLSGLLSGGILKGLAGNDGSACAKASLIDQIGILALLDRTDTGPVCKNIIACCPDGVETCIAIDNSEGAGKGGKGKGKN
ncbi:spore-wall fungal hydrophobin dewA [Aspergillus cavernicola]|uniref:Hydrophobin n=1 Tax=Aspergillus cavernicola TaxID=176166 RepID=A0ABR4I2M6_9EURO